jgi:Mg2+ and Co2+ transporter CorA
MNAQHLTDVLKAVGGAGGLSVIGYVVKVMWKFLKSSSNTNKVVNELAENHLPHLQKSLNEHSTILTSIQSDVRNVNTRLDNQEKNLDQTRDAVKSLGVAFVQHLNSKEK